jgi:hypothetical protein
MPRRPAAACRGRELVDGEEAADWPADPGSRMFSFSYVLIRQYLKNGARLVTFMFRQKNLLPDEVINEFSGMARI